MKMPRKGHIKRETRETRIDLRLTIDGKGGYDINTSLPFIDHMLELFSKHGLFDLKVKATGDTNVDDHHLVEDLGISLGEAFKKALGDKKGIRRYGFFIVPMDEAQATVSLDFSGRQAFVYKTSLKGRIKNFEVDLIRHFFEAFAGSAKVNLHIEATKGCVKHHIVEAIFKAFARSVDMATQIDPRVVGVPSTKGRL